MKHLRFRGFQTASSIATIGLLILKNAGLVVLSDTHKDGFTFSNVGTAQNSTVPSNILNTGFNVSTNGGAVTISSATDFVFDEYSVALQYPATSFPTTGYTLEGSNDGITYTLIDVKSGIVSSANAELKTFAVTLDASLIPPVTPPVTPSALTPEEIIAADKIRYARIVSDLRNGVQIIDDDSIFYTLGGNSAKTTIVMNVLDNGGGYADLLAANTLHAMSLSDSTILRVMSIYLVKVDTVRFQNEAGLELINSYARLQAFTDYLTAQSIAVPSLTPIVNIFRSNTAVFNAVSGWALTNPA